MALKPRGVRWCAVAGCGCCGCLARCVRAAGALGLADAAVESSERLAALLVRVSPCKAWWTSLSPERFWARLGGRKMQAWAASVEVWRRGKTEDRSSLRLAGEPRAKRVGNQFDGFKRQHARCD
ncbi:hypothetical protein HDV62DRAFT_377550 [Trichoderma sp. SZMC 28011]